MHTILRFVLLTIVLGVLLGVITSFGQTFLPDPFRQLANSYSVWLFFSFIAGYSLISSKKALIAGVIIQYLAIAFYYIVSAVRFDMSFTLLEFISLNLVWIIGGTFVGPIAGLAGAYTKQKAGYRPYAIGFMAGLFISEAMYQFIVLGYIGEGIVFLSFALIFLLATYYKLTYPIYKTALAVIGWTVVMYVGYAVILRSIFS